MQLFSIFFRGMSKKVKVEAGSDSEVELVSKKKKVSFIDSLRIYAHGGAGGQGLSRYGGVGGEGGSVIAICDKKQTLRYLREKNPTKRFVAEPGKNSRKLYLLGERGSDLEVHVPPGVEVVADEGKILGDLNEDGQSVLLARGGKGGNLHNSFAGQKGEARIITLDLKLIADIGLVGFPNAGKSTFLKAISRAKPKIANYPFTTIRPQIGFMEFPDFRKISVADLPGLIEGAHANFGMGHEFLKHVERTKVLLFLVDVFGFQLRQDFPHRTAFETVLLLLKELELYDTSVAEKPAILALNKLDLEGSSEKAAEVTELVNNLPGSLETVDPYLRPTILPHFESVVTISGESGTNVEQLKEKLRNLLDYIADEKNRLLNQPEFVDDGIPKTFQEHAHKKLM